jgi:hypothetical protein
MQQRLSDWEQRLSDYLLSKRREPFEYGKHDCAHFVAGAVEAITGENPMAEITKDYKSEIGSLRVLKELGFDNVEQFTDSKFTSTLIGFAQTGDIALHDGSLGIVIGGKAVFVGEMGYTFIDRSEWSNAWEVGRG